MLDRVQYRADFLQTLIDDLLDLAAGKADLSAKEERVPVCLDEAVERVVERFKVPAQEKAIALEWHCDCADGPIKIAAMNEIAEFDQKYARKLEGPVVAGASAEEMAAVMAMYPGVTQALAKVRAEDVNMDGTPILSTVTIDSVKSAEQMAEASKQRNGLLSRCHYHCI
jgi:hypothetical protein